MYWNIYENGVLINTICADEDFVISYCQENGYTYSPKDYGTSDPPTPSLTPYQQSLINDFNDIQSRIIAFIQDHSWATTRATFDLATQQYDAMVDLYLVLADRIRYENLESYVTIS